MNIMVYFNGYDREEQVTNYSYCANIFPNNLSQQNYDNIVGIFSLSVQ